EGSPTDAGNAVTVTIHRRVIPSGRLGASSPNHLSTLYGLFAFSHDANLRNMSVPSNAMRSKADRNAASIFLPHNSATRKFPRRLVSPIPKICITSWPLQKTDGSNSLTLLKVARKAGSTF